MDEKLTNASEGFTLLEVLAAIFIFSIIMTIVMTSFSVLSSNTTEIKKGISTFDMAKACLNRMTEDLQSIYITLKPAYITPDFSDDPDMFRIVGEPGDMSSELPRLRFASRAHMSFSQEAREGIAEIVYYIEPGFDGKNVLKRGDTLNLAEPFEETSGDPVLCEQVKTLEFTYYGADGEAHESWDSESNAFDYATPSAIGIHLEIGNEASSVHYNTRITLPVWREGIS